MSVLAQGIDPTALWLALIATPANLLLALATYRKARSTDAAVNHRVTNTTISEDIANIRIQLSQMERDIIWLTRQHSLHLREHINGGDEGKE